MMTNIRYRLWAEKQDKEFLQEIHGDKPVPTRFQDDKGKMDFTLEELAELDIKYITIPEELE